LTNPTIASLRLLSQGIGSMKFNTPEQVVKGLGAVQAQDFGQAVWGVGLRTASAGLPDVELAIAKRKIVLTWPMRGTIFMVPAEDVLWMLKLTASRLQTHDKRRQAELGLDGEILKRCRSLIERALHDGVPVPRPDLMTVLEEDGISTKNGLGNYVLGYLSRNGMICFGPREGNQQTFVLLEAWVGQLKELTTEEALAELALRYFTGHGPATVQDFAWWTGLSLSEAKRGAESVSNVLQKIKIDNAVYWMSDSLPEHQQEQPAVHLLPGFDEYYLGYKARDAVIEPEHDPKIAPYRNGVFQPMLVVDGRIAGVWKRENKRNGVEVSFAPFTPLEDRKEDILAAACEYAKFLGLPLIESDI